MNIKITKPKIFYQTFNDKIFASLNFNFKKLKLRRAQMKIVPLSQPTFAVLSATYSELNSYWYILVLKMGQYNPT